MVSTKLLPRLISGQPCAVVAAEVLVADQPAFGALHAAIRGGESLYLSSMKMVSAVVHTPPTSFGFSAQNPPSSSSSFLLICQFSTSACFRLIHSEYTKRSHGSLLNKSFPNNSVEVVIKLIDFKTIQHT